LLLQSTTLPSYLIGGTNQNP